MILKLSKADGAALLTAVQSLAVNGPIENAAKKARESAKKIIDRELINQRKVDPSTLPDKTLLTIQVDGKDVLKIERKSAQRLDTTALTAAHPDIAQEFTKSSVASYYSALV